jgi:hypothetical protein
MSRLRTHVHEKNREPATTRRVRAAGVDIARFGEAHPATHENDGAAYAVAVGVGIGIAVAVAFGVCGKA